MPFLEVVRVGMSLCQRTRPTHTCTGYLASFCLQQWRCVMGALSTVQYSREPESTHPMLTRAMYRLFVMRIFADCVGPCDRVCEHCTEEETVCVQLVR